MPISAIAHGTARSHATHPQPHLRAACEARGSELHGSTRNTRQAAAANHRVTGGRAAKVLGITRP